MEESKEAEERVMRFTAAHWRVRKSHKLTTNTRLAQDLGMDGNDAVEFFEKFAQEFSVDLYQLRVHWNQHFAREGISLGAMVAIALCVTAGFWLRDAIGVLPPWAWGIALIATAALSHRRFAKDNMSPVTIGDLAESVRLGRWSKPYFGSC
jgi:hypothetical protein